MLNQVRQDLRETENYNPLCTRRQETDPAQHIVFCQCLPGGNAKNDKRRREYPRSERERKPSVDLQSFLFIIGTIRHRRLRHPRTSSRHQYACPPPRPSAASGTSRTHRTLRIGLINSIYLDQILSCEVLAHLARSFPIFSCKIPSSSITSSFFKHRT